MGHLSAQGHIRHAAAGAALRGGGAVRGNALFPAGKHRADLYVRVQRGGHHFDRTVLHRISGELAAGRRAAAETLFRRVRRRADGHYPHRFERQLRPQAQPRRGHPRHAGGGGLGLLLHPHEENRRVPHEYGVLHAQGVLLRTAVHASRAVHL